MTAVAATQVNVNTLVDDGLKAMEQAMFQVTNSDVDVLRDASRHILGAGGKRIRPRLLLLAYLAMGGDDLQKIAKPAAAVELMHTASVVHDDINDHGIVRRGRPSVNSIWGRTFALLTGDFLFTAVYELMAPYGQLNVDLANAATALVEGETLQASAVKNKPLQEKSTCALYHSRPLPCSGPLQPLAPNWRMPHRRKQTPFPNSGSALEWRFRLWMISWILSLARRSWAKRVVLISNRDVASRRP